MSRNYEPLINLGLLGSVLFAILLGGALITNAISKEMSITHIFLNVIATFIVFIVFFYIGTTYSVFKDALDWFRKFLGREQQVTTHKAGPNPVEIAKLRYTLDDPDDRKEFDKFLDEPAFMTLDEEIVTPAQLVETVALDMVRTIERQYHGNIIAETKVARGSLTLLFGLTALDAITLLANYHDVVESIELIRRQTQSIFSKLTNTYREKTDRDAKISSEIEVVSRPIIEKSSKPELNAVQQPPAPVSVTNSFATPPTGKEVNVSVNFNERSNRQLSGCMNTLLMTIMLVIILGIGYLLLFTDYQTRQEILSKAQQSLAYVLRTLGSWLYTLGSNLSSSYE